MCLESLSFEIELAQKYASHFDGGGALLLEIRGQHVLLEFCSRIRGDDKPSDALTPLQHCSTCCTNLQERR